MTNKIIFLFTIFICLTYVSCAQKSKIWSHKSIFFVEQKQDTLFFETFKHRNEKSIYPLYKLNDSIYSGKYHIAVLVKDVIFLSPLANDRNAKKLDWWKFQTASPKDLAFRDQKNKYCIITR